MHNKNENLSISFYSLKSEKVFLIFTNYLQNFRFTKFVYSFRGQVATCQQLIHQLQNDYEQKMRKVAIDFVLSAGLPRPRPELTKKVS